MTRRRPRSWPSPRSDAHVPTRRGLRDDVGHERPVDREEAARHRPRRGSRRRRRRAGGARRDRHADRAEAARRVDHGLAPDPLGEPSRRDRRDAVQRAATTSSPRRHMAADPWPSCRAPARGTAPRTIRKALPPEDEEARRDEEEEAALAEDVGSPRVARDRRPAPAAPVLGPRPSSRRKTSDDHRREVDRRPSAIVGSGSRRVREPSVASAVPVTTRGREQPDHPARQPDLRRRTRSGTYPWNGPWAKFELNWSSVTNAATARHVLTSRGRQEDESSIVR